MPQYWLKLQPHCSLLAWTRGLRNNQRARLVVVVEDVAAVIWMVGGLLYHSYFEKSMKMQYTIMQRTVIRKLASSLMNW